MGADRFRRSKESGGPATTNGANNSRKLVVMSRYDGMEPDTIALTAWTRLDKFPVSQFAAKRVLDFDSHFLHRTGDFVLLHNTRIGIATWTL